MWLYGSGFPKSMNIGLAIDKKNGIESPIVGTGKSGNAETHLRCMNSIAQNGNEAFGGEYEIKQATNKWNGWGTALKPAYEPIIVARKPFAGSCVDNVIKYGVGGINIDECRVGNETISIHNAPKGTFAGGEYGRGSDTSSYRDSTGRFPANVILTYDDTDYEEVCGGMPYTSGGKYKEPNARKRNNGLGLGTNCERIGKSNAPDNYGDSGSACRYFYCAKASKRDRDEGLEQFAEKNMRLEQNRKIHSAGCEYIENGKLKQNLHLQSSIKKNIHPTVKPTDLMQYLIRLVTPDGGIILDPFNGSGSTGKAAMYENKDRNKNYKYIGIELTDEYLPIARARIEYACGDDTKVEQEHTEQPTEEKQENWEKKQINIFDML